ncbi:unnamed protein product [Discula destructiva]
MVIIPSAFSVLALPLAAAAAALASTGPSNATYPAPTTGPIAGTGLISVLVNTTSQTSISLVTGSPSQSIGCLNAAGKVVLDDCALFTAVDYHVSTAAGVCSFWNADAPVNSDAVYGHSVHAFECWSHAVVSTDTEFYTVSGLPYNWLGQSDIDFYYDLPALPESSTDEIDFWYFVWGSQQTGVPEGHYQALLLWEPVS